MRRLAPALVALALSALNASVVAQTPEAVPAAAAPAPVGQTFTLPSPIMEGEREINVLLPDGYEGGDGRYAVIYILDGGQAQDFPTYAELIRDAIRAGEMQPVIVVGVASQDRQNELTERATDRQIIARWPSHGQSERFRRFLTEEVKPWVETRYRTNGDDAVLGESAAALFIVETFLEQPTLFDRYLAISPSLWWDRQALSKRAAGLLAAHPAGERQLLLTIGDEGGQMQAGLDRVLAALRRAPPPGLTWRYEPHHEESHSTIYRATAPTFLREALPPLRNRP